MSSLSSRSRRSPAVRPRFLYSKQKEHAQNTVRQGNIRYENLKQVRQNGVVQRISPCLKKKKKQKSFVVTHYATNNKMRTSAASSLPSIQGAMSTHVYVRTREPYCSAPEPNPRGLCPMLIVESRLHIRRHARAPSHLRRRFRVGSQRWGGMGIACRVGIRQSLRGWDVAPFERRSWGYGVGWGRRGVQIKLAISGHATAPLIQMFLTAALF